MDGTQQLVRHKINRVTQEPYARPFAPAGFGQDCLASTVVRVLDKHSQPVANVTADQLRAEIDGSPSSVISFSAGHEPGIILALDASGSMKGYWNQSIAAARQLMGSAGENIDIVVFRDRIQAYARGLSESDQLLDRLATQTPTWATALYDTLVEIGGRVTTRDAAIVVITDGEDDASRHSSDATVSLFLRSSWPPVFGLILDYAPPQTRLQLGHVNRGLENFKKIPAATGGLMALPASASKVPAAMNQLAATVFAPFALTLRPSRPITKPAKLKLELIGPDGKPRHDVHPIHVAEVTGCDVASHTPPEQK